MSLPSNLLPHLKQRVTNVNKVSNMVGHYTIYHANDILMNILHLFGEYICHDMRHGKTYSG